MYENTLILGSGGNKFLFNTKGADGAPITLAGTPSLACRVNGSATQATAGLTLSVDFDSITGHHQGTIDVDDGTLALADGDLVEVYIAAGTVDSISVVGTVLARLSISDGSLLTQTTTDIQAACAAALVAIHLDHLLAADYDPASKPGTATALLNELVENNSGVSRFTAAALTQAWSAAARTLTAGTNIALAKGTGVTGFNDLDASGVRSAVGLSSANLATIIAAVQTVVDALSGRVPAALVNGRTPAAVLEIAGVELGEGGADPASPIGEV